ncbi:hypothetical protein, partial [Cohnella sp. GbtcB17]|uniref:hypothetical protein n=1 Tax=Cohnella sp. GbtcB17 TaxID=2824762 RepID=UPI001C30C5A2
SEKSAAEAGETGSNRAVSEVCALGGTRLSCKREKRGCCGGNRHQPGRKRGLRGWSGAAGL